MIRENVLKTIKNRKTQVCYQNFQKNQDHERVKGRTMLPWKNKSAIPNTKYGGVLLKNKIIYTGLLKTRHNLLLSPTT